MPQKHRIELKGLQDTAAKLGVVSLPVPNDDNYTVTVEGSKSQSVPIGLWPAADGKPKQVRRSLLFFENRPDRIPVVELAPETKAVSSGNAGSRWEVEVVVCEDIAAGRDEEYWHYYKRPCDVRLRYGSSETAFALAVLNEYGLHKWQYVQSQKLWSGELVEVWRIGGHIYTGSEEPLTMERLREIGDVIKFPDDTIAASIYLLLFSNGTVQVTGHWINGRIYGAVGNQKGAPVVAFSNSGFSEGPWDGSECVFHTNGTVLNLSPSAHMVSEEHPGAFLGKSLWKPFQDTKIITRHTPEDGKVVDMMITGSDEGLVQGAARSVTWLMGLGPDWENDVPAIARYLAPPDWYAACCEFAPFPIELKEGDFERLGRICAEALLRNSVKGKFISGGIYRYLDQYGLGAYELSLDANEARSLFRRAYRDSEPRFYDLAMRNSYFMADIATDHSRDIIHYHNDYPEWRTYSLIYQRFSGIVLGYMETGDYYLLETAEAVARNYMSQHMQNWPRQGIGRDADPLNGFLLLWEYTGKQVYFEFAREFAHDVSLVIDENGGWLSGSGVGPMMGCNAAPGSAWNGGHFLNGFTEYAMHDPDIPQEWLDNAGRALRRIYDILINDNDGFHPASSGFIGRIHWYLACRLQDKDLIAKTHELMNNILEWEKNPKSGYPIFTGPAGHHQNNYIDYLIFYQATKDSLAEDLRRST